MIFIFHFVNINILYCIDLYANAESSVSWNKFHLIVVYGPFNVLLDLKSGQYHVGSEHDTQGYDWNWLMIVLTFQTTVQKWT